MTGAIPPYGKHFRLDSRLPYHTELSSSRYVLKANPRFYIRSDKTSKVWWLFIILPDGADVAFAVRGSLTLAMDLMREVHSDVMMESRFPAPEAATA